MTAYFVFETLKQKSAEFFGNFEQYEKFLKRKYKRHTKRGNRKNIKKEGLNAFIFSLLFGFFVEYSVIPFEST